MKPENFFGGYTLYRTDNFLWRIHWNTLYQKMNVVTIEPNLQKMNFVSLLYSKANFFQCIGNRITQYISSILDRTNKMIQKQTLVVALMDMLTHIHKSTYLYATPEAEPRGILLIKEAFKLKLYEGYTDKEIQTYLADNGLHIPKSSLNVMWLNPFYAGYFKNSLIPDTEIEGHWEPLISSKEFKILNHKLKYSSQNGIPKISGKTETPLTPKFLICSDCNCNMTSYLNKARQIYYFKCSDCNNTN